MKLPPLRASGSAHHRAGERRFGLGPQAQLSDQKGVSAYVTRGSKGHSAQVFFLAGFAWNAVVLGASPAATRLRLSATRRAANSLCRRRRSRVGAAGFPATPPTEPD